MSEIKLSLMDQRCVRFDARHVGQSVDPEEILDRAVEAMASTRLAEQLLGVDFDFFEYWRDQPTARALLALYLLQKIDGAIVVTAAVVDAHAVADTHWQQLQSGSISIDAWLDALRTPLFRLDRPISLQPIAIPKPWGREIWYTGIERRGVAEVGDGRFTLALPLLLAIAPRRLLDGNQELILLKILDPLPEEVFGDLYFEMHQQKQEVYVVTAIDARAWPDGKGAIRFGFNAELRAEYGDDRKFIVDYLASVKAYRQVRKEVDSQFDARRTAEGIALDQPVSAALLQRWIDELPASLNLQERTLRAAMERFTGLRPLQLGDVVKVPCLVPHSLQHGVRTVEFQTPVYERLILSFAQKVLTQSDWDTDTAATLLCMDPPAVAPWRVTGGGAGWREEQIVEFDDFSVRRVAIEPAARHGIGCHPRYRLLMAVGDGLQLDGAALPADAAKLLPAHWGGGEVVNNGAARAYLLVAAPRAARG